jgi:hypothetical protein
VALFIVDDLVLPVVKLASNVHTHPLEKKKGLSIALFTEIPTAAPLNSIRPVPGLTVPPVAGIIKEGPAIVIPDCRVSVKVIPVKSTEFMPPSNVTVSVAPDAKYMVLPVPDPIATLNCETR